MQIIVNNFSDVSKTLQADESFKITVDDKGARLFAETVWGALYGLETFSQLVAFDPPSGNFVLPGCPIYIQDRPRFPWRGLLIDTANQFISVEMIMTILETMSYDRFNVLHWHIVGSYSFAAELKNFSRISEQGPWYASAATYTQQEIQDIVAFGHDRGVRVVPELDVPGHTYSWGLGYPNLTVACPTVLEADIGYINSVPLDPTNEFTYTVLNSILTEFSALFPDRYFHVGGDELQYECWATNPNITAFMRAQNISSYAELQTKFEKRLLSMLANLNRRPVFWADTFAQIGHVLPKGSIVEVWNNATLINQVLAQGLDILLADGWYLDRQVPVDGDTGWFWQDTWAMMYSVNLTSKALGGEANMWSEQVSDLDIMSRIWPRASAVAERLWSPANVTDAGLAAQRLGRHRCVLSSRGLSVGTIWSSYCHADLIFTTPVTTADYDFSKSQLAGIIVGSVIAGILVGLCMPSAGAAGWTRCKAIFLPDTNQNLSTSRERQPLLVGSESLNQASIIAAADEVPSKPSRERLSSLDVFRGMTIALMIFVDNVGSAFPEIDHCPWDGIALADFVMPFFDWIVGVSLALAFQRFNLESTARHRWSAFRKATWRFLKLFLIGVATQGGIDFMDYNMSQIRIMGILQRVAVCYYVVALMEIFLPRRQVVILPFSMGPQGLKTIVALFNRYLGHWLVVACLLATHTGILYGVDVPPAFQKPCGRGVLTPRCNAATYIDSWIITPPHMYFPANGGDLAGNDVTFERLPECSGCSPGKCRMAGNQTTPVWCTAGPFDPEGLVSTLNAVITTIIGVHMGHALIHLTDHTARLMQWIPFSAELLVIGIILHFAGVPMNTDLYSISYTLVTGGAAGLVFSVCYLIVDVHDRARTLWRPFMFFGMNAITMYLLAEGGILQWFLSQFYLGSQERNLANIFWPTGVYWGDDDDVLPARATHNVWILLWCIAYIILWMFVAWLMYRANIIVKI